ncbi:LacI family DNA-binding transcriptional regulator [Mycolicibacterium sp. YH-1]|uniref:LacI family DNA-binding transcriptional regulator n=1 Tax=Mycolicibacterium sp. YH-1 TaxID=2908837 RepID=UPI001F4C4EBB|nr:LacI family DNA-binding transcriptional regulator [Mycolicibacterium sp. YH-1]UNB52935.1 LacI family transcriptional regulator [Mycolicibacterium sp. YH-1]
MRDRPTLADVAQRAGVSRALVSIVMRDAPGASDATRLRVRQAADEMGYRPDQRARMLRSQRANLLGVVFTAGQEFHAGLVDGVYQAAEAHGYDVLLSCVTPHHDESRAVRALLDDRCEALLLIGSELPVRELAELDTNLPVVVVARKVRGIDAVRSDDVFGAEIAVAHLADLGHTAITYLHGGRAPGAAERRKGFRKAAAVHGITAHSADGGVTERDGATAAAALLADRSKLPTAVIAFNDRCALGFIDVTIRAGIHVPQDISVVGFDDSPLAGLAHVDLTTVGQDSDRLAELAVTRAVERIESPPNGAVDEVSKPRLIVRGSTARPHPNLRRIGAD